MQAQNSKIRQVIIKAAIELFKERGYSSVSVNDICKRAYVARSSFYYIFSGKKDIIEFVIRDVKHSQLPNMEEIALAKNDFERMWLMCDRYLKIAVDLGHEISASLLQLELEGELEMLLPVHSIDDLLTALTEKAQHAGVVRNMSDPRQLGQLGIEISYQMLYDWARCKGAYPLRERVRKAAEAMFDIAPQYRMSEEELVHLR